MYWNLIFFNYLGPKGKSATEPGIRIIGPPGSPGVPGFSGSPGRNGLPGKKLLEYRIYFDDGTFYC